MSQNDQVLSHSGAPLDLDVHVSEHYGSEPPVVPASNHPLSYELGSEWESK